VQFSEPTKVESSAGRAVCSTTLENVAVWRAFSWDRLPARHLALDRLEAYPTLVAPHTRIQRLWIVDTERVQLAAERAAADPQDASGVRNVASGMIEDVAE
jgi:hypothetical protein